MLSLLLCLLQAPTAEKPVPESPRLGGFQSEQRGLAEPSAVLFGPDGGLVIVEAHAGRVRGAGLELDGLVEPRGLARADDGTWFVSTGAQLLRVRGTNQARIELNGDADARAEGLAVTADALYVADSLAHCVRVLDPKTGAELHRIGTRGSNAGELLGPRDVAVSPAGEVYVADTGNHRVQVFAKNGAALRSFGSYGPYPGLFSSPSGLDWAIDSLWVADTGNHRIQRFNAAGEFLYGFGAHSIRPRDGAGRLHYPSQLAVAPDGKRIAIVEGFENRVQIFGEETAQSRLMQLQNELSSSSHYGGALALSGRLCAVLEPESANAVALDTSGLDPVEITRIGRFGDKPDLFARPTAVVVDGEREELYFADSLRGRISCFSVQRRSDEPLRYDLMLPRLVRARSTLELGFEPRALARHADGRLFVLGSNGTLWRTDARLERFEALLPADRERALASSIAIDSAGARLAIANPAHHELELCSSSGQDLATITLSADANHPARPSAVTWTPSGTLLIADELRHDLCEIDSSGRELRRIGRMGLARGEFFKPRALALDAGGRIWVLDAGNHRVQILSPAGEFVHAFGSRLFIDPLLKGFQAPAPGDWESWPSVSSARMGWRIHYRASSWPPAVGETIALEAVIVPLSAGAQEPRLVLDGAMPEHGHGLARDTRATRLDAPRPEAWRWRFEGLRLHMGGRWRLYFDVHTDGAVERAEWEVVLE